MWLLGLLFLVITISVISILPKWVGVGLILSISILWADYLANIVELFDAIRSLVG